MHVPKSSFALHKAATNSGYAMKKLAHSLSNSKECSSLKLHLVDLIIELDLAQKTTDKNKIAIIAIMLQRRSLESALEYILNEWNKRINKDENLTALTTAFQNIGMPGAALIVLTHLNSKRGAAQISKKPLQIDSTNLKVPLNVYYRKPLHFDGENDHLLDIDFGTCQMDYHSSDSSGTVPQQDRKRYIKKMSSIMFALICFQIITAFTIHLTMKIDGPNSTNATMIFEHLHDHYDQFRSDLQMGIKKILDATYYEEYNISDHKVLHVTSYLEYQKKMYQYSRKVSAFTVFIDVKAKENWPHDVSLGDSKKIIKMVLRGNLTIELVASILKETKNLQELVLTNTEKGICHLENPLGNGLSIETEVVLPELRRISFENFHTCSNVYDTFSQNMVFRKIQEIHFINSTVNDGNKRYIQHFIRGQASSLKSLYFNSSTFSSLLFDKNMPTLSFVAQICLDFFTDNEQHVNFIGNTFSRFFPNLKTFVSERGHVSLAQVLRLFDCEHLISLKIGVAVDAQRINLDFMRNSPESLKKISLFFKFLNKTGSDICEIEGYAEETKRFSSFEIGANCDKRYV